MCLDTTERTIVGHGEGRPPDDEEEDFTLIELAEVILIIVLPLANLLPNKRKIQESLLNA